MLLAQEALNTDVLAPVSQASTASRVRTIGRILSSWGLQPWPPTSDSLRALAATLKWRNYRSASVYLFTYRTEAQRAGHVWPEPHQQVLEGFDKQLRERARPACSSSALASGMAGLPARWP